MNWPVARDEPVEDLLIRVAGLEALAHQHADVVGERGVALVDRLVLADQAAQLGGDGARPRFQHRVLQHLVRLDGMGWGGERER